MCTGVFVSEGKFQSWQFDSSNLAFEMSPQTALADRHSTKWLVAFIMNSEVLIL